MKGGVRGCVNKYQKSAHQLIADVAQQQCRTRDTRG